jgi:hypothetical protein
MHHAPCTMELFCVFANQETLANDLYGAPYTMHHGGSLAVKVIYDYSFHYIISAPCTMHHGPLFVFLLIKKL